MKRDELMDSAAIALLNYFPYLLAVIPEFTNLNPAWTAALYTAVGMYGIVMEYRKNRVTELLSFIRDNPDVFTPERVGTVDFQDGFLTFMPEYLKQRSDAKRKILQNIIAGYAQDEDKQAFELERLENTLITLSLDSLKFLEVLKREIIPQIEIEADDLVKRSMPQNSDRSPEWWNEQKFTSITIYERIDKWRHDNYFPDSPSVKQRYGQKLNEGWEANLRHCVENEYEDIGKWMTESLSELVSSGVLRLIVSGGGGFGGGAGADYSIQRFGRKFIAFI
jgi:hypothetical protein